MTAPNAPMSAEKMIDPLKAAVHCVREHRGGIRGAEMEMAVAAVAAMAEREAALVARILQLEERDMMLTKQIVVYAAERDALRAKVEALRADAERYQELRSRMIAADFEWGDPATAVLVFRYELPVSANLDAMIDAARAESRDA